MSCEETKSGFVAVVGRPNAGKSSLLNFFVGEKLAMVSHKANATRKRLNIIAMHECCQIIFVDTPGIHESERLMNQFMLEEALKAMGDADLVLFLSPVTDTLKEYENFLKLNKKKIPHIVLLTKTDEVKNEKVLQKILEFQKYQENFLELIPVSIKRGTDKSRVFETICKHLPSHPYYYDPEILTTDKMKDIYKELIREAVFEKTSKEIPYFTDVVIERVEEQPDLEKIYAQIVVEKKSQKGIIIGKDGETLRRIGHHARKLIEELNGRKTFLKLFVVVKHGWTKDKKSLGELGYNF